MLLTLPPEAAPKQHDMPKDIFEEPRFLLAAIIDSSEDAIISKDLNGIITSWNRAASRMYGYTAEEMVGQSILRLIPAELHSEEDEILRRLRAGERLEHFETTRVGKNGEKIEVSLTISPVKDSTGRIIGSSKIARDISTRKKMERTLVQSEKLAATGRMAATIAHEINNPLESVLNLVFLARESSPRDSEAHSYLRTAEKEIERISHIARQTLGYYRDSGAPGEVSLHDLFQDVLAVYQSKLSARKIAVEYKLEALPLVKASRGELIQVFSNIIANSIDAMERGGTLGIQATRTTGTERETAEIVIRDQGCGIPQANLARIFEPFFTTKNHLGNGIGLWVTKQLVEKHGGRITVTSSTERGSSGTSVLVSIPFIN
ncbi:MAG TPA: PAS domain S-box protein [Acidobacteriaceae bacterium]|nr:PAS domain S-box protein [Acidobacteriaceae bacterium]